jgi:hypothetical protein
MRQCRDGPYVHEKTNTKTTYAWVIMQDFEHHFHRVRFQSMKSYQRLFSAMVMLDQ